MACVLWAGVASLQLRVTHHVRLGNSLISATEFRQNGSLVGSQGYMSPSSGFEAPLLVKKGKEIKIKEQQWMRECAIIQTLGPGRYLVSNFDQKQNIRAAIVKNGVIQRTGPDIKLKSSSYKEPTKSEPDNLIRKVFPPPQAVDTGIRAVYWSNYREGYKLGGVEFGVYIESMWRAAIKTPTGKVYPLEKCVRGLEGFIVRGIQYVDPKGWMVVDATVAPKGQEVGGRTNFGNHLFWIEPR